MSLSTEMKSVLFGTGGPYRVSSPEISIDAPPSEIDTHTIDYIDLIQGKARSSSPLDIRGTAPPVPARTLNVLNPPETVHHDKSGVWHSVRDWSKLDNEQVCYIWGKDTFSFPDTYGKSLTSSAIYSPNEYITEHFLFIQKAISSQLDEALSDLQNAVNEASQDGFLPPSDIALNNAEYLLREMYALSSRRFEIYPTPDREIAIDAPGGYGRSVILLCDSDGGALCLVNMNGKHRRARYSSTEMLPDGFLREALIELEQENG